MKKIYLLVAALFITAGLNAQITITASDMPASGDTLRMSLASAVGSGINLADSGTSFAWNYSALVPRAQTVDTYKTAYAVSPLYLLISTSAYGYKVADSFPGGSLLPVSITSLYTFFEKQASNTRYAAVAFAAKIAGVPSPFNYSKDDILFRFPLNYGNSDSSNYALNIALSSTLSIKQTGYRKTRVDGWGTIVTPFYTTPTNCLRVRSEIRGVDSINIGFAFAIPRNSVEYKWMVNGDHYPALWVTTNVTGTTETITSIRYRDQARTITLPNSVEEVSVTTNTIKATPNPATNNLVKLDIPSSWSDYIVEVFDMQAKLVLNLTNTSIVDLQNVPAGQYVARVISGTNVSYVKLVKP